MVAQAEEQILVPLVPQGPVIVKVVLEGQGVLCDLFTICVNQSVWACQQSCFRERAFRFRKLLRKGYYVYHWKTLEKGCTEICGC